MPGMARPAACSESGVSCSGIHQESMAPSMQTQSDLSNRQNSAYLACSPDPVPAKERRCGL